MIYFRLKPVWLFGQPSVILVLFEGGVHILPKDEARLKQLLGFKSTSVILVLVLCAIKKRASDGYRRPVLTSETTKRKKVNIFICD